MKRIPSMNICIIQSLKVLCICLSWYIYIYVDNIHPFYICTCYLLLRVIKYVIHYYIYLSFANKSLSSYTPFITQFNHPPLSKFILWQFFLSTCLIFLFLFFFCIFIVVHNKNNPNI